jgi:hypothetical protein
MIKYFFALGVFIVNLLHCPQNCLHDTSIILNLTRVEAGWNTSTVNLRVVRGDEMGLKKAAP